MSEAWAAAAATARRTPGLVPALMRYYGARVAEAVEALLQNEPPAPHLSALVADYPRRGGKRMRPSIAIAVARAHGGSLESILPAAAGIELFHNALLIHDDIADGSEERRGRPALQALHGIPLALNAGDALLMVALRPLLATAWRLGERTARLVLDQTLVMARETVEGQALEIGWRDTGATDLTEADYLAMVMKKTAWSSIIWPAQVGALVATGGEAPLEPWTRFGFFLGAAFQIEDDLLNFVADRAYGKERHGDLYEGKRTLILLHARRTASAADRARIDRFLAHARGQRSPAMVGEIARIIEAQGSIGHARKVASALAGAAAHEGAEALGHLPPSPDRAFLEGLVPWVFERG